MSYTIFIANPTALIPQPGRAVNTFPSGLVRVDQTYLGLTSQAATHRATLAVGNDMPDDDSSPCIDGLKIFPEVQERRREDGFTEYIVSAYGRNKSTLTIERRVVIGTSGILNIVRKTVTASIVSREFPSFENLNIPDQEFDPISAYIINQSGEIEEATQILKETIYPAYTWWRFVFATGDQTRALLNPGLRRNSELNIPLPLNLTNRGFGYWAEWVFAYG